MGLFLLENFFSIEVPYDDISIEVFTITYIEYLSKGLSKSHSSVKRHHLKDLLSIYNSPSSFWDPIRNSKGVL